MGEVVDFPKANTKAQGAAKGAPCAPPLLSAPRAPRSMEAKNTPADLRTSARSPQVQPGKRPSWGVFDNPDGDTPDAA